jgi:hypothetical protein
MNPRRALEGLLALSGSSKATLAAMYFRRARVAGRRCLTALAPAHAAQNRSEVRRERGAATRAASTHQQPNLCSIRVQHYLPNGRRISTAERGTREPRFFGSDDVRRI